MTGADQTLLVNDDHQHDDEQIMMNDTTNAEKKNEEIHLETSAITTTVEVVPLLELNQRPPASEEEPKAMDEEKVDHSSTLQQEKEEEEGLPTLMEMTATATTATASTAIAATTTTTPRISNNTNKVMIYNVLKYVRPRELQKMTQAWERAIPQCKINKVKKPPQRNWVLVTLESPEMVPSLVEYINQNKKTNRRGKPLHAVAVTEDNNNNNENGNELEDDMVDAEDHRDSNKKHARADDEPNATVNKRAKVLQDTTITRSSDARHDIVTPRTEEQVKDAITPLWKLASYDAQLNTKYRDMIKKCARKIVHEVKSRFRMLEREAKRNTRRGVIPVYPWLEQQGPNQPAIRVDPIVPSPQTIEYRNKCEFTFGYRYEYKDNEEKQQQHQQQAEHDNDTKKEEGDHDTNMMTNDDGPAETVVAVTAEDRPLPEQPESKLPNGDPLSSEKPQVSDVDETAKVVSGAPTPPSSTPAKITTNRTRTSIRRVPSVGCMASGWSGGVSRPHPCQNIPTEACALVDVVDDFLSTSPIPPYQQRTHSGLWRLLTVRMSRRTRECMVLIQHASPAAANKGDTNDETSEDYSSVWESERQRLIDMLTNATLPTHTRQYEQGGILTTMTNDVLVNDESNVLRVTSIFFQEFDGLSTPSPDHPVQHAFGKTFIEERLGQCTFQISPGAFFQVNTEAAEKLYQIVVDRVREVSNKPEETILLDICCGTGTIGITCLKEGVVGRVLGVDLSIPAIENAKRNAELNGFQFQNDLSSKGSTRFVASRAEHVIAKELAKIRESARDAAIVAVVDPARDGLHADVVATIRANEKIQRLVYVSCNPTATFVRDAALLCAPPTKKYPGRAFRPVSSQPVDMFPLTTHCEMVMTFERLAESEMSQKDDEAKKSKEAYKETDSMHTKQTEST